MVVRPAEVRPVEVRPVEIRLVQIGLYFVIFIPPPIPNLHPPALGSQDALGYPQVPPFD